MAEDQNTNIDCDMKTVFDATAIIRKSITKCTKWKFTGSLKNLPDENIPVEPFFIFLFFILLCIVTHTGYNTYTATLLTRLIDILTLFIILRIQCNLQCRHTLLTIQYHHSRY